MIPSPPLWPRLLDDLTESYVAWREASGAVRRAYLWWREASPADWWWAFTAYRAALDREEPAARVYADLVGRATCASDAPYDAEDGGA